MNRISEHHILALSKLVGPRGATTDPAVIAPYCREWRDKYRGATPLLLMPHDTKCVSQILSYCHEHGIAVVPQGGNTGLVGGGIPGLEDREEILLSLTKMTRVSAVDPTTDSVVAEAGATIHAVQQQAKEADRLFPLSLASEGSCTVGGTIATNAGGIHVIRYGTMRSRIMGLEYVLPGGSIVSTLAPLIKDNTGYDLTGLLAGSEGTLAVITQARLKLAAPERAQTTVWATVRSMADAVSVLASAQKTLAPNLSAFETISAEAMTVAAKHTLGSEPPVDVNHPWHLLIECGRASHETDLSTQVLSWIECLMDRDLILSGTIAQNERQRHGFWALRDGMSEAQKKEGASIKHDIAVPLDRMTEFVLEGTALLQTLVPGCRPTPFGHLGDGNLHFNVLQPLDTDPSAFLSRWEEINNAIHELVHRYGGSISAEHGIGRMKKDDLKRFKEQGHYKALRAVKAALDPKSILNPGVLF